MKSTERTDKCVHCDQVVCAPLFKNIMANGAFNFVRVCPACKKHAPFGGPVFISKADIAAHFSDEQIDEMPVIMPAAISRCVVCGDRTSELHHWAPKHLFKDEADKWPQDYLCRKCHQVWHNIVTPEVTWS